MTSERPARKLVVTLDESERWHGRPAYVALLELLRHRGLRQAVAVRALAGFAEGGAVRTAVQMDGAMPLPVRVEAVAAPEAIEAVLPDVRDMVERGQVEVEDVRVALPPGDEEVRTDEPARLVGRAKMLQIHVGDDDRWEGEPLHQTIVKRARQLDMAGATVTKGVLGFGAHKRLHRHHALALSSDDPVVVTVIDSEEKVNALLAELDHVVTGGCLVAISDVTVVKYAGHGAARVPEAPRASGT